MFVVYKILVKPRLAVAAIRVNADGGAAEAEESELPSVPIIPSVVYFYPQNTQVIELDGLQDAVTLDFSNAAAVSGTLYDSRGNPDSVLQNIPMLPIADSNGNYRGSVPDTFDAPQGSGYTFEITATDTDGNEGLWSIPAQVVLRVDA